MSNATNVITLPTTGETDDSRRVLNGRIPASIVYESTRNLPPEQRDLIRWAHAYYWDKNISLRQFGELIGIGHDGSTLSRVFRNDYQGRLSEVLKLLEEFRAKQEIVASKSLAMPWQQTDLGQEIIDICDIARKYQAIVEGFGESQVGKTCTLRHIASEDKEGTTLLFEVPPGASEGEFLVMACARFGLSARSRTGELWQKLASYMAVPQMLVILDEGARAGGERAYGGGNFRLLERLRWLHDTCQFGLFFCGTNITRDQLQAENHKKYLNQWNRRVLKKVQFPDIPSRKDLNVFSRYYGLEAATGDARLIEKSIVSTVGLGQWLKTLAMGKVRAGTKPMTWEHVLQAASWMKRDEKVDRRNANRTED